VRRWIAIALGLASVLVVVAAIALRGGCDGRAPVAPAGEGAAAARQPGSPPGLPSDARGPAPALPPGELAQLPPGARRYQELRAFQEEARVFFAEQADLPELERETRAAALRKELAEMKREGLLLPAEALVIELGLLEASASDPAVYEHEARLLLEESEREARRRAEASRADPRFEAYKRREAELVREVMALEEIPGGRSRNDYLRERLQQLRSEIYGGHP
jgi:hypothetical protein